MLQLVYMDLEVSIFQKGGLFYPQYIPFIRCSISLQLKIPSDLRGVKGYYISCSPFFIRITAIVYFYTKEKFVKYVKCEFYGVLSH